MGQPAEEAENSETGGERTDRGWARGPQRPWLIAGLVVLALAVGLTWLLLRPGKPICIAVATSLTGESATQGQESLAAIRLAVAEANHAGGVHGRRVELVTYDDRSMPEVGRRNASAIATTPCLAVLGHYTSTVSLAAGPVYRLSRIPALTASAFADDLTEDNPWYFRAQITASMQGRAIAEYLAVLNGAPQVELVHSEDSFGRSFKDAFLKAYPAARATIRSFDPAPSRRASSVARTVQMMPQAKPPRIVVLGTASSNIPEVLKTMRRSGRNGPVITTAGAGSSDFINHFAAEPEESRHPGFFTNNLHAVPPVIFDSAGARAQAFAARYRQSVHRQPSWIAASYYDATRILLEAMRRSSLGNRAEAVATDRDAVRASLSAMNGPLNGVEGLTRPLYFNARRNMPGAVRMGVFARGRFMTSASQLVPVEDPDTLDLAAETEAGRIVTVGGEAFWKQKVVYTGLDFNRISRVDLKDGSFNADINLWLRYIGENDAVTKIEFPDLLDHSAFDPGKPVAETTINIPDYIGEPVGTRSFEPYNYRLYRIASAFKANYDLHDYPFDEQQLLVRFINNNVRRELITYVVDSQGLELANSQKRIPTDLTPFRGLQQWHFVSIRYFVDSLSLASSLGRPAADPRARTEYSGYNVAIELQRNYRIFLIKTLIPLILLATVVFATLFLPNNLFRERINIPVTAILTSSVLLLSVNNQLGDVGYTVTIEYIFYAFFALCLSAMLIGVIHEAYSEQGRHHHAQVLARAGQVFYLAMVLLVIVTVWLNYAA